MSKVDMMRRSAVANEMVRRWGDDYLMRRSPADLVGSYGLTEDEAARILQSHRRQRGLV